MVLLFSLPGNHQRLLVATEVDNQKQVIKSLSSGPNCSGFFLTCFRKCLVK